MNSRKQEILSFRDNRYGDNAVLVPSTISEGAIFETLNRFQGKNLEEWSDLGVTVFKGPGKNDGSIEAAVFDLSPKDENGQCKISTSNSMGVIRLRDNESGGTLQIEIGSRFDTGERQFFLAYLLSKVFGGSVVDTVALSTDSLWDMLLAFAFRRLLIEAGALGSFRQYRTYEHNDMRIRGRIDVDRHLRHNIPFRGNVSYATHEISFDNPINHLIRHALAKVSRQWGEIFTADSRLTHLSRELTERTPTWESKGVLACVTKKENRMPIRHPFFHAAYEPLRKISLSILRNEGAGLYQQQQEAEGVIFDGAWLWEEYIWTLLKRLDFEHPENRERRGVWEPLSQIKYFPDFFHREKQIVLDAKYKWTSVREKKDVAQVFTYMFVLDAIHGGLIKPDIGKVEPENIKRESKDAKAAKWHEFGLIPASHAIDARIFVEDMKSKEEDFLNTVRGAFGFKE
jgi:5-methylcytosine-specific restriction enzyme subunit McrC